MIGSLIAAAALTLACPEIGGVAPTKEEQRETEGWLNDWMGAGWIGASPSDQRFRIEVHSAFGRPGYEMRGWRTATGWRVFSRQVYDPYHHGPLLQPDWRERDVDPPNSGRIDAIWDDACLWAMPRIILNPIIGGKFSYPAKPTAADQVELGTIMYDLKRGEKAWVGYQAVTGGPPAKLAALTLSLVVGPD